jgi:hypothetical protein
MIVLLPQTGHRHRSANEVAGARQWQWVSGCFIGGTLLPYDTMDSFSSPRSPLLALLPPQQSNLSRLSRH